MKIDIKNPPRVFSVGNAKRFDMRDCGNVALAPDEQITFLTERGGEFDVARKSWGFYATPSLNGRLPEFGLRGTLIRNRLTGRYFVLLVEKGCEKEFESYLEQECCDIVTWLDTTETLDRLRNALGDRSSP